MGETEIVGHALLDPKWFRGGDEPIASDLQLCGNMLLVEDTSDIRRPVSLFLRGLGVNFAVVDNGDTGVMAATAGGYDVVLMDMQMPVMDGVTAFKTLRMQGFAKPIIALAAKTMRSERDVIFE